MHYCNKSQDLKDNVEYSTIFCTFEIILSKLISYNSVSKFVNFISCEKFVNCPIIE